MEYENSIANETNDFNINESEYIQDLDNQLEFYQLEEPNTQQTWQGDDKHVLVPIEDEPLSHKLNSIDTEHVSSLEFQNFGENDFIPPSRHHHHHHGDDEMVDLEPAEYIRVPVKLGPDKTYSVITQEEADEIERNNQESPPLDSFNHYDWSSAESDMSDDYDDTNERKGMLQMKGKDHLNTR